LHLARVADQSARYYLDDLGDELRRVAPVHGVDAGRWVGGGTAGLGLSGPVDGPALQALLGGRNPHTGHPLASTQHRSVAGFDLVFSTPKSVSLFLAVGDPGATDRVPIERRCRPRWATSSGGPWPCGEAPTSTAGRYRRAGWSGRASLTA
jgi:hypothetical protein